jgi:hypothetical protein
VILLCIDPGKYAGWARFRDGSLEAAGAAQADRLSFEECDELVVEVPQYRPHSRVDPNDLITLAWESGKLAERVPNGSTILVFPSTWKGSVPKEVHNRRVTALLSPDEVHVLESALCWRFAYRHNMVDAVGLGLWRLGRLRRGG